MHIAIILNQIFILALLVFVGIIATRYKIITQEGRLVLAKVIINVTLPFLLATKIAHLKPTAQLIESGLSVFVLSFFAISILYFSGRRSAKIVGLNIEDSKIHLLHTMFGNIIFIGFPLFDALFPGGEGLFYAAIFQLSSNSVLWTAGIMMLDKKSTKNVFSKLLNINTIAFIIGVSFFAFSVKLPSFIIMSFGKLGETTIYLSMLYIGSILTQSRFKSLFQQKYLYSIGLNKLILSPIIILIIIKLVDVVIPIPISQNALTVLVMQSGMPCMAIVVMLCAEYGYNAKMASENLFFTTLFSVISIPFLYWFIGIVW